MRQKTALAILDPGSAPHRFALRRVRDTRMEPCFRRVAVL